MKTSTAERLSTDSFNDLMFPKIDPFKITDLSVIRIDNDRNEIYSTLASHCHNACAIKHEPGRLNREDQVEIRRKARQNC